MEEAYERMKSMLLPRTPDNGWSDTIEHKGRRVSTYRNEDDSYITVKIQYNRTIFELTFIGKPDEGNPEFANVVLDTAEYIMEAANG